MASYLLDDGYVDRQLNEITARVSDHMNNTDKGNSLVMMTTSLARHELTTAQKKKLHRLKFLVNIPTRGRVRGKAPRGQGDVDLVIKSGPQTLVVAEFKNYLSNAFISEKSWYAKVIRPVLRGEVKIGRRASCKILFAAGVKLTKRQVRWLERAGWRLVYSERAFDLNDESTYDVANELADQLVEILEELIDGEDGCTGVELVVSDVRDKHVIKVLERASRDAGTIDYVLHRGRTMPLDTGGGGDLAKIRVYYWDKQRKGNYLIRVGKKRDVPLFKIYVENVLRKIDSRVYDYRKEIGRRYYVQHAHIEHMKNDDLIDLREGYIWRENLPTQCQSPSDSSSLLA